MLFAADVFVDMNVAALDGAILALTNVIKSMPFLELLFRLASELFGVDGIGPLLANVLLVTDSF